MPQVKIKNKRERLVESARFLIHRQGFYRTTLADIASKSGVPLGNIYYYFKTKDEIAAAVVQKRTKELQAESEKWMQETDPKNRLNAFLDMVDSNRKVLAQFGCSVGSLCQELDKARNPLTEKADGTMRWQVKWATDQFKEMGQSNPDELAQQFVSNVHGAILLSQSLQKQDVLRRQLDKIRSWIDELQ
jgi:AcrR family transcriptional regulator